MRSVLWLLLVLGGCYRSHELGNALDMGMDAPARDAAPDAPRDALRDAPRDMRVPDAGPVRIVRLYLAADDHGEAFLDGAALEDVFGDHYVREDGWNIVSVVDFFVTPGRHSLRLDTSDLGGTISAINFAVYLIDEDGDEQAIINSSDTDDYECSVTSSLQRGSAAECSEDPWRERPEALLDRGAQWVGCAVNSAACEDFSPYSYFILLDIP